MFRFGPNGMNQSFGNRCYIISENVYNNAKNRLKSAYLLNINYLDIFKNKTNFNNTILFLDPPYVNREITYNNGFDQLQFLELLKQLTGNNTLIMYTDCENKNSDDLINYGYIKIIIRQMRNIGPSSNKDYTLNECLYYKYMKD